MAIEEIWNAILPHIKAETSGASFDTYFKRAVTPVSCENNRLTLSVPTEYLYSWLNTKRYMDVLKSAVSLVLGPHYEIKIRIGMPENIVKPYTPPVLLSSLNPRYTFDSFVIGNSNRFAHAAALAVATADSPEMSYNPLFLYGGVGLGKTHLMHAIGHYIYSKKPSLKIMYVTSEKFTNEMINSIQTRSQEKFREKYRTVDVLLIDDIQFLAKKEGTQEEFFHTFNELRDANKQIVISSDRPPKDIPTLEERLRSRFEWGLIADLQRPDFETRVAILRKKTAIDGLDIDDEVLQFIAEKIVSNIRELEGSLTRVIAYSALTKKDTTIELVEEALKDFLSQNKRKVITANDILDAVSEYYDMDLSQLTSIRQTKDIVVARQISMYIMRELTDLSYPKIGEVFKGKDHTTIMHACKKVENLCKKDQNITSQINDIINKLKE